MKDFETKMEELEAINDELASGNVSLEEALKKYRKGIALADELEKVLAEAEAEIAVLTTPVDSSDEAPSFAAFDGEAD